VKELWRTIPAPVKWVALGITIGQFLGTIYTVVAMVTLFLKLR